MREHVAVTFLPSGATSWVQPGTTVLEAARAAHVTVVAPCGGRGVCGSCGVRVVDGELAEPDQLEREGLARAPEGIRLACRALVSGPVTVKPVVTQISVAEHRITGSGSELVVGVDLGTTNVAALAVEAVGGREIGHATVPNLQTGWGGDVLSRVSASLEGSSGELRDAATDSITAAISAAIGGHRDVVRVVVAANTVMAALLTGVDLDGLATAPYLAPTIPLRIDRFVPDGHPLAGAEVLVVPPLASFVGGDALAGALHCGLLYADGPSMLVDIGTNAEIILVAGGRMWVTSAPAGPAFEGVGIECGGPAGDGAVVTVRVTDEGIPVLDTIGSAAPAWFSGAGLLSALAALRRLGHVTPDGALAAGGPLAGSVQAGDDGVLRVRFATEHCLSISQLDIRALQLAKAAVRVGIEAVLQAAELSAAHVGDVYVAGAFGGAICVEDLVDLGIVPASAGPVVRYVGNSSLAGATAMALDPSVLDAASAYKERVEHVDLAADPSFAGSLMRAVALEQFGT